MKYSQVQDKQKAILFAMLIIAVFAILQGVVYLFGFITYWLPVLSTYLALYVIVYFSHEIKASHIIFVILLVAVLSVFALFIANAVYVMMELQVGFQEAINELLMYMESDKEILSAFITDEVVCALFAIVGGIIEGVVFKKRIAEEARRAQEAQQATQEVENNGEDVQPMQEDGGVEQAENDVLGEK